MTASPGDRFAVNTYAYTQDMGVLECLSRLADQGYTAFELMVYPGHLWPAELDGQARRAIRSAMAQRGLRLVSLNMPNVDINVTGASAEMRQYSLGLLDGRLAQSADRLIRMGWPPVTPHSGVRAGGYGGMKFDRSQGHAHHSFGMPGLRAGHPFSRSGSGNRSADRLPLVLD